MRRGGGHIGWGKSPSAHRSKSTIKEYTLTFAHKKKSTKPHGLKHSYKHGLGQGNFGFPGN